MSERESGGLDSLFGAAEEPAVEEPVHLEPPRGRSRAAWIVQNVLLVVAATVVTEALLRLALIEIPLVLVIGAFIALRLLMLAVAEVKAPPVQARATVRGEDDGAYRWAGTDSLRAAVSRWERTLQWSQSDPNRFSRNVLPVLAELTDERLRLRHGFTRATDPRRAREMLGDLLWELLADPSRRPPKPRELQSCLDVLERL